MVEPDQVRRAGVVGAGVIGGGWALHFLRMGLDVDVYDPAPGAERDLLRTVEETWPLLARPVYALQRLGIAHRKKLYGTLGAGLFFLSTGKYEFLEKIIERLNPFG